MAKRRKRPDRRPPGSGSIRRLANGTFKASYPKPGGGYWSKNCHSMAEAEAWLATFAAHKAAHLVVKDGRQTLGEWLQTWLNNRPAHLKATTREDYAYKLGFLTPLAHVLLVDLTVDMVDDFFRDLVQTTAGTTVSQVRGLLNRAMREAYRRRYIAINPAEAERTSRPPQAPRRRLPARQAHTLLGYADGFYTVAWWLIVCCGLRAGEICGLRRVDVDLEAATISIVQQYTDVRGTPTQQTPKTPASVRTLPIPRAVADMLHAHLARLDKRAHAGRLRGTWQDHNLVFPGKSGRPLNTTSLRHALRDLTDAASSPPITTHELRHTCAGILESLEAPEYIIAGILGHGPKVVTRRYAPPTVPTMRPWIERVYRAIVGGSEPTKLRQTP